LCFETKDTHTKRQATQHGCLPSWLGDGDKGIEKVYGEEKNILYLGLTRAAKVEHNLFRQDKPYEPTKKGLISFVLLESSFTSDSTVSRDHPF
jgi:hypothetical protein